MRENLPPPHWSPTGNSGTWHWDESGAIGEWRWTDDEQLSPPPMNKKTKAKKNWYRKLFDFFLTKK